jgi:hypothetical protein
MKPYTWEEIAKAPYMEKQLIVKRHGLLGAVAIELAGAMARQDTPSRILCAVNKLMRRSYATFEGPCPSKCPLAKKRCDYDEGKENLIKLYAKLYKKVHGAKK